MRLKGRARERENEWSASNTNSNSNNNASYDSQVIFVVMFTRTEKEKNKKKPKIKARVRANWMSLYKNSNNKICSRQTHKCCVWLWIVDLVLHTRLRVWASWNWNPPWTQTHETWAPPQRIYSLLSTFFIGLYFYFIVLLIYMRVCLCLSLSLCVNVNRKHGKCALCITLTLCSVYRTPINNPTQLDL